MTVAVTVAAPPVVVLIAMAFEPLAKALGVTVKVVVTVAPGATLLMVSGAKFVAQLPDPLPGTVAVKVNERGPQLAGSLLSSVIVEV